MESMEESLTGKYPFAHQSNHGFFENKCVPVISHTQHHV